MCHMGMLQLPVSDTAKTMWRTTVVIIGISAPPENPIPLEILMPSIRDAHNPHDCLYLYTKQHASLPAETFNLAFSAHCIVPL